MLRKTICGLLVLVLTTFPLFAEELVVLNKWKGLQRNPAADKIDDGGHTKFDNVYLNDGNIQVVKGRNRMNSTAHTDATVNGLYYYETSSTNGESVTADLLLHCDGADGSTTIVDSSNDAYTVTVNGNMQLDDAQEKFGTASCLSDGSGDYLTVADNDDWHLASSAFTIDFQVRFNSGISGTSFVMQRTDANNYWILHMASGTQIQYQVVNSGVAEVEATYNWTPSLNTWYHVELSKSGNDYKIFIDGTSLGTTTDSSTPGNFTGTLNIGHNVNSGAVLNGWIDEVRFDNGTAYHTSNFTAPSTAYEVVNNTPVQYFIVAESDEIVRYNVDGSNRTQIASGLYDDDWDFTQVGLALYMQSKLNGQYKWQGSSTASRKTSVPLYKFIEEYKGVLFVAQGRNLRYSNSVGADVSDDETWDSANHLLIGADYNEVAAIKSAGDSLLIFTPASIQQLTGFGASTFRLKNLANGIGAISNNAVEVDRNGDVIFFAGTSGVFKAQVGGQLTDSSNGTIIDRTNTTLTSLSSPDLDSVFQGDDSQIDLDPTDYTSSHSYYDTENDLYFLYIDEHCFVYDNANKAWSHLPATQMVASTYVRSVQDISDDDGYLLDNLGFFYRNWIGYENGIESGTVTGNPTSSTSTTLTCSGCTFNTTNDGLKGLWVAVENATTKVIQYRQISSNTATVLTVSSAWSSNPSTSDTFYIAYVIPDILTKQYGISGVPNETDVRGLTLVYEKAASTQNLIVDYYLNKSTSREGTAYTIDLSSSGLTGMDQYIKKIGSGARGAWIQWGLRSFVYSTSDSIDPPVNLNSFAVHAIKREKE